MKWIFKRNDCTNGTRHASNRTMSVRKMYAQTFPTDTFAFPLHTPLAIFIYFSLRLYIQWHRIILSEPRTSCTKSTNDSQQNDVKDAAAEFEVQANQTIVDKYRSLKLFKQQMTQMKRNFNEKILKLQHEKHTVCEQLSQKIEKFRQNYKKLYANDKDIDVDTFTENVLYFDGKSFKVERLTITYWSVHSYFHMTFPFIPGI